jgi:hypothetical protein
MIETTLLSFFGRDGAGLERCKVCHRARPQHDPRCPVDALQSHTRAVAAHVGLYVADLRETLTTIERVLAEGDE